MTKHGFFEDKYLIDPKTKCWNWIAAQCMGYGYYQPLGTHKHWRAHRYAWFLKNGEIPSGMNICHSCDNTLCVNPDHLFAGTQKDNMKDMSEKGRAVKTKPGTNKLPLDVVLAIRAQKGIKSGIQVARDHNISFRTVYRIWNTICQ